MKQFPADDETPACPDLVESVTNARTVRQVRRLMAEHTLNCPECLMRKTFNSGRSGRPPVMRTCPKCGKKHTGREMRKCPAPPANRTGI